VPAVDGPLEPRVVYPPAGAVVDAADTSFIFGSVGTGRATLTINGAPVEVRPNGAWLAWVALPPDSVMRFELVARRGEEQRMLVHEVRRAQRFVSRAALWIDTTSFTPRGTVWWPRAEALPLSVRAAEGASLTLVLPGGARHPLHSVPAPGEIPGGIRAVDRDTANLRRGDRRDVYRLAFLGISIGDELGSPLSTAAAPRALLHAATLEAVKGGDTLRAPWPLQVTLLDGAVPVVRLDDDPDHSGRTDGVTVGRALPGGTYHWFFPTGTIATVRGRINDELRLALSVASETWIPAREATPVIPEGPLPPARLGSLTATPLSETRVLVRLPLSYRAPYRVEEMETGLMLRVYHAVGDPDWIRYGETRGPLARVTWMQAIADEVELRFELAGLLWGYRLQWERSDLLLEIRTSPAIDPGAPLRGRLIVVDPGHPPAGATGPTGLYEAEANLAVARALRDLLAGAGASVVLTRSDDRPLDLWPRVRLADSLDADLLVSIHNNALPDGVNPFSNNGSSVFYFHPRSIPLARAVQAALVERLGLRDLGVGRGNLALVRGTWMPSILTEGLFMMLPEQEAALRDPRGRQAYAEAVFNGIARFLAAVGVGQ
jgi:N-acetylmuramoyl-L-alanine amidase